MNTKAEQLLGVIDRIATRLALTDDSKLEQQLDDVLAKLISLIVFPDQNVRNKIMRVLTHINQRVKSVPEIKLPTEKILALYLSPAAENPFLKNFSLVYLDMAFERCTPQAKAQLLQKMWTNISKLKEQQPTLLRYLTDAIQHVTIPYVQQEIFTKFEYMQKEDDQKIVLDFWKDVLLCQPDYSLTSEVLRIPSGLSIDSLKRILGKKHLSPKELVNMKRAIARFLATGLFPTNAIFSHLLIGSCDDDTYVSAECERAIKKSERLDLENEELVANLFRLYLGAKEEGRSQASEKVKLKILYYLVKSVKAANFFPHTRHVIADSLFAEFASPKLKDAGMQFFIWVVGRASDDNIKPFATEMFNKLVDSLFKLKANATPTGTFLDQMQSSRVRDNIYISIGTLAKRFPELVRDKFMIVQIYFQALETERASSRMSVQQGLSNLISAFKSPNEELKQKFTDLFLSIISNEKEKSSHAKLAALKSTNKLFSFNHIPSRLMCLLCSDDLTQQVKEEALRGIDIEAFSKYRDSNAADVGTYPNFPDFISYVYAYLQKTKRAYSSATYVAILQFSKQCLIESAKIRNKPLSDYVVDLESLYTNREKSTSVNQAYLHIIQSSLTERASSNLQYEIGDSLMLLVGLQPDIFAPKLVGRLWEFKQALYGGDEHSRERIAKLLGVLYFYLEQDAQSHWIKELRSNLKDASESKMHASILLLGNIISLSYKKQQNEDCPEIFQGLIDDFVSLLDYHKPLVQQASCYALGEIGRQGALCYVQTTGNKKRKVSTSTHVIQELVRKLNEKGINDKLKESIVTCLGLTTLGTLDKDVLDQIFNALFSLTQDKAEEIHFTIGEALSYLVGGRQYCTLVNDDDYVTIFKKYIPDSEKEKEISIRSEIMKKTLARIIKDCILHPKKIAREAGAIWCLAIVKYCEHSPSLLKYVKDLQQAFTILLSDTNDVTQEVASKGLSLVYNLGDTETKKKLVRSLVDNLSGKNKKKDIKITDDSELMLFPEDAKAGSGGGSGMSTYKELCSVANDLGKPELLYKFLSISSHHVVWNAKKAAAFSVASIASLTGTDDELKAIFPKIVPKLYRYLYDPNPTINRAMTEMWKSLVDNTQKTVDSYLKEIMKELIANLNSPLWRVREACCMAIADVYSGRRFVEMEPYLEQSLELVFRVTDDIKESCIKAAKIALQKLGFFAVKSCNPVYTNPKDVARALKLIIPILLKKGIYFPVDYVRVFSLQHLSKIVDVADVYIKPHITDIVGTLLEQMSALEPAMLNYLQNLYSGESQSKDLADKLDSLRLEMSKQSPVHTILNSCKKYIDDTVMVDLIPRLLEITGSGVGVSTRASTANFICDLAKFQPQGIKPHVKKVLKVVMSTIKTSNNLNERKALASAVPYILRLAKVSQGKALSQQIVSMYVDSEDTDTRLVSGVITKHLAKQVPTILKRFYDILLPTMFIARFDKEEKVREVWKQVWEEVAVTGTKSTLQAFTTEVSAACCKLIDHSSWVMKRQGGQGLYELAIALQHDIPETLRDDILVVLSNNLPGRYWDGKEILLDAYSSLATLYTKDSKPKISPYHIVSTLVSESSRKSKKYQLHALKGFNKIMKKSDIFAAVVDPKLYELERQTFTEILQQEKEKVDNTETPKIKEEQRKQAKLQDEIQEEAIISLGYSFPLTNDPDQKVLIQSIIHLIKFTSERASKPLVTKDCILTLEALGRGLEKMKLIKSLDNVLNEELVTSIASCLFYNLDKSKQTEVRVTSLNILNTFVGLLTDKGLADKYESKLSKDLEKLADTEKEPQLKSRLEFLLSKLCGMKM